MLFSPVLIIQSFFSLLNSRVSNLNENQIIVLSINSKIYNLLSFSCVVRVCHERETYGDVTTSKKGGGAWFSGEYRHPWHRYSCKSLTKYIHNFFKFFIYQLNIYILYKSSITKALVVHS